MREQSVAEVAFREWIRTLPKGVQINAIEAMERGLSYTFDAWMEAWRQASLIPHPQVQP